MKRVFLKTILTVVAVTSFLSFAARAQTNWSITGNSATSPGTNFLGSTDSKDVVVKTNGKEAMRVTKSQSVGIGMSVPAATLDILPNTNAALQIEPFGSAAGNTGELRMAELVANGLQYVGFKASDNINNNVIWTLPSADGTKDQVLTTDGAGNLSWAASKSANTTLSNLKSPTAISVDLLPKTDNSVSLGNSSFRWKDVNINNVVFSDLSVQSTGSRWLNNGSSVYYNDSRVGIGNSAPSAGLLVVDTRIGNTNAVFGSNTTGMSIVTDWPSLGFNTYYNAGWTNIGTGFSGVLQEDPGFGTIYFETSRFSAGGGVLMNPLFRMAINNQGFVGINTNTNDPRARLEIGDPIDNDGMLMAKSGFNDGADVAITNASSFASAVFATAEGFGPVVDATSTGSDGLLATTNSSSAFAGFFDGDVFTTGFYLAGGQKLQQNIRDVTGGLSIIDELHPRIYEFKKDADYALLKSPQGDHYGLIAQDVEKVLPNVVKDVKFDTNKIKRVSQNEQPSADSEIDFKSVNYTELIPVMIKAMQENRQTIDALRQQIEDLKQASSRTTSK